MQSLVDDAIETDSDPEQTAQARSGADETVEYSSQHKGQAGPFHEETPERLAGYRIIRSLGSGGMGTVFEAEDESHGQRVAIKLIAREYAASDEAVQRFRREGRLASAVTHPRCVFVLGVDDDRGRPFIVMELMPGTTLQSLVEKSGPLDPASAIVKVFDVLEGLQEFHKRGLIHRDVKPSNCFLEHGGRVKIGDFGLSKSLEGGADLTRSGTFIGTPLYASPEQIKRDDVDERTDVYSLAATLYFLLTGGPPVQAKDAAEALARIVSEPAPPLRNQRRDLPRSLESVVLRGLERDRARRFRNLREFHDALLPFVPERLSIAGIGLRVAAYVIDLGCFYLISWAILGLVVLYHRGEMLSTVSDYEQHRVLVSWAERTLWILYFWLSEGIGGASLGKWMVGLRVSRVNLGGPPGPLRGLIRALAFYVVTELPADLWHAYEPVARGTRMLVWQWISERLLRVVGVLALWTTMRQKNGFRGPHEWVSGSRVVRVAAMRKPILTPRFRSLAGFRVASDMATPSPSHLQSVGPYEIRGAARWQPNQKILIGHDSTLNRPVWIVLRSDENRQATTSRRDLNRQGRLRWIGAGDHDEGRWEAFTAPAGVALTELVTTERLAWRDVLPLLRQLADELQAAITDQTLPVRLTPEQVWLTPDGNVQLVDILGGGHHTENEVKVSEKAHADVPAASAIKPPVSTVQCERRAMWFLGEVARLALEGPSGRKSRGAGTFVDGSGGRTRIRAAIPERAALILDRLTGIRQPFESLQDLSHKLDVAAELPVEVTTSRRAIQLAIQAFFLLPGLVALFAIGGGFLSPKWVRGQLSLLIAIPLLWSFWAYLTRGGYSLAAAGIELVRTDGRRASRIACLARSILVWLLPTALLAASWSIRQDSSGSALSAQLCWFAALVVLIVEFLLGLFFPRRGPHDQLAGTVLVPF